MTRKYWGARPAENAAGGTRSFRNRDPPARLEAPPSPAAPPKRYFAWALRLATSASLRSVMTPIWLAR